MPLARATGIGSTFDCAAHSYRVWRLASATISSPVIVLRSVSVAIRFRSAGSERTRPTGPERDPAYGSRKDPAYGVRKDPAYDVFLRSISSRFDRNSFPGFHSGNLSACAMR